MTTMRRSIESAAPERPVAALAELKLDEVADHHVLAAAQDAGTT
jgi:hypothetical protein